MILSSVANADMGWTDNDPYKIGGGKEVVLVYPQFINKWVIFRTADDALYYYAWDSTSVQMTENAKGIMSILLTAISTKKKVSFYYDKADASKYKAVTLVNIHN